MHNNYILFRRKSLAVALAACFAGSAFAADSNTELQELKAVIQALQKKVEALEKAQTAQPSSAPIATPAASSAPTAVTTGTRGLFRFYGSLDNGVEITTHAGADKKTVTRVPSTTGSGPSVLGIDVGKDVGGGIKALGKLEMGIFLDSGSSGQASRLFGRQAYVGIDYDHGSFTVGRQYNMLFWGLIPGDLLGPNIHGLGSIDPYIPNARTDNSVAWRGRFGGWALGLGYSFGRDTLATVPQSGSCAGENAASTSSCRSWSALAGYRDKDFGMSAAIDRQFGGTGATVGFVNGAAPVGFVQSSDTDTRSTLNGYYQLGTVKLGAGWLGRKVNAAAANVKQNTSWIQADWAAAPTWRLAGGLFRVNNNNQSRSANMYALRATYLFDDQLSTYLSLGYLDNSTGAAYGLSGGGAGTGVAVPGTNQTGTMLGVKYRF